MTSPLVEHKTIGEAILAVMREVSYIQKERKSGVQYAIKSERSVIKALRESMMNNGLVMWPESVSDAYHERYESVNSRGKTISYARVVATFGYRLHHVHSNTDVFLQTMGEGVDNGDKAGNKAMTVSKKYALLEGFLIETGNDPDNTSSSELQARPKAQPRKKAKAQAGGELEKGPAPNLEHTQVKDPAWTEPVKQRTWTNPQKDVVIEKGAASNRKAAEELLNRSVVKTLDSAGIVGSWAGKYAEAYAKTPDAVAAIIFADTALTAHREGAK